MAAGRRQHHGSAPGRTPMSCQFDSLTLLKSVRERRTFVRTSDDPGGLPRDAATKAGYESELRNLGLVPAATIRPMSFAQPFMLVAPLHAPPAGETFHRERFVRHAPPDGSGTSPRRNGIAAVTPRPTRRPHARRCRTRPYRAATPSRRAALRIARGATRRLRLLRPLIPLGPPSGTAHMALPDCGTAWPAALTMLRIVLSRSSPAIRFARLFGRDDPCYTASVVAGVGDVALSHVIQHGSASGASGDCGQETDRNGWKPARIRLGRGGMRDGTRRHLRGHAEFRTRDFSRVPACLRRTIEVAADSSVRVPSQTSCQSDGLADVERVMERPRCPKVGRFGGHGRQDAAETGRDFSY